MVEMARAGCVANAQKARCDGIEIRGVEFVKVAVVVDKDVSLEGFFGERIVADTIMGEVVKDFEGEEIAGRGIVGRPIEDGPVDNLHAVGVAARGGRAVEV